MTKSRYFIVAGVAVLGIASIFATKPTKKIQVTSGRFFGYTGSSVTGLPTGTFTTTSTNKKTVILATIDGTKLATLLTVGTGANNKVFKF